MIRWIYYESELAPVTKHRACRSAAVDRQSDGWCVMRWELGPRHGKKQQLRTHVTALKQAQKMASD